MIPIRDLIPCFNDDPLQIYMRRKLGFRNDVMTNYYTSSSSIKSDLDFWKKKSDYKFMSEKDVPNIFSDKYFSEWDGCFNVSIVDPKTKVVAHADMLLSKKVIQEFFGVDTELLSMVKGSWITTIYHSSPATPYQQYLTAVFMKALSTVDQTVVDSQYVCIHYPKDGKTILKDVRYLDHLLEPFERYVEWYNIADSIDHESNRHEFLYPNMKYMDGLDDQGMEWKTNWAIHLNEITLLPSIKPSHRIYCKDFKEIYVRPSILDDMKLRPKTISNMILKMLQLKFDDGAPLVYVGDQNKFDNECLNWHRRKCYLFIDFETIDHQIYMIGIGRYDLKNGYKYECIIADNLVRMNLQTMLDRFKERLSDCDLSIDKIFYWHAERQFLNTMKDRFGYDIGDVLRRYQWVDMCRQFRQCPILIRDCYNFKLKTIWSVMKKHGMIDTENPPDTCCNGLQSIDLAVQYYKTGCQEMVETLKAYNAFDCKVMFDIINYFRIRSS